MSDSRSCTLQEFLRNLDESQKSALKKLRNGLVNELLPTDNDFLLVRFLKARNFDVAKAEKMLSEFLKFRKNLELDVGPNYTPPELYEKYTSWVVLGTDKDGDPVTYILLSAYDFKGLAYSASFPEQVKYSQYILYKHHLASKKPSIHEAVGSYIFDLDGFSYSYVTSPLVMKQHYTLMRMYLAYCPELLKTVYIINAPAGFPFWFNLYKRVMDLYSLQKFKIYGRDGYKDDLLEAMDAEILPACIGGTRTDPDGNPNCLTLFRRGFLKVPTSYYLKDSKDMGNDECGTYDICIKERASYDYRVRVDNADSVLKWYVRTLDYNIKFGVFYVSDKVPQTPKLNRKYAKTATKTLHKVGYEPIIPVDFIESHVLLERGEYTCEKVGTYIFRFDNTFSWITPKEVSFKVDVLPSEEKEKDGTKWT